MFRFVKIAYITASSLMIIIGVLIDFLSCFILYLNKPTTALFNLLEEQCKLKSDEYGGTDITTLFMHINIQACLALPLGFLITTAGIFSVTGAGNLNSRLLKLSLIFWVATAMVLFAFLVFTGIHQIDIDEPYMYCWLAVLTDQLQMRTHEHDEIWNALEYTEKFLDCCGVRAPSDYNFYAEVFGSDGYPRSCCYDNKWQVYLCRQKSVGRKLGCYYGLKLALRNRKRMFTTAIGFIMLFLCPLIYGAFWLIRGITRFYNVKVEDFEESNSSLDEAELDPLENKT